MSSSRSTRDRAVTPEASSEVETPVRETPISLDKLSNSLHHKILDEKGVEELSIKRKREEVESRLAKEVIKDTIKGIMTLVGDVFHDAFLSVHPGKVVENDDLRNDEGWTEWPEIQQSISEPGMEAFIELISDTVVDTIKKLKPSTSEPRYWSSMFYEHPVQDPKWDTSYKPDLVLLNHLFKAMDRGEITWKDIVAIMEIKSKKEKQAEADKQVSRYAQCIFNAQPGRRFVIALTVVGTNVTLWIFDRSGAISCEPFSLHSEPEKFLRIIIGTLFFDPEQMGYDPTVYDKGGDDLFITVGLYEYKVSCIYHEPGIRGRGTVCYRGENQSDGSLVVIKDSWVDVAREETEVMILQKLNERSEEELCTPDGVRVIPKLVDYEVVETNQVVDGKVVPGEDTTAIFRHGQVEWDGENPKWAWTVDDRREAKKTEIRRHFRVVMSPYGMKLENFASLKDLMRAFNDVVHAVRILTRARILHRDISFRNILLHEKKGRLRGLLIDYDYAISMDRSSSEAIAERTGTLPFMAIDRLQTVPSPHKFFHDLESLFYVICWMSTLYSGPHNTKRPFFKVTFPYKSTKVAVWNGDVVGENTMSAICNSKIVSASMARGFLQTLKEFSEYFRRIEDCLLQLRVLLFDSDITSKKDEEKKERTKKELETELSKACELLKRRNVIERFTAIPIHMRPAEVVLDSFTFAFEDIEDELTPDELAPVEAIEEEVEYQTVGARRIRDFVENISPGVAADIEPGNDTKDGRGNSNVQEDHADENDSSVVRRLFVGASASRVSTQSFPKKRKSADVPEGEPSSPKRSKPFVQSGSSKISIPRLHKKGNRTPTTRTSNDRGTFAFPALPRSRSSAAQIDDVAEEGEVGASTDLDEGV